MSKKKLRVWKLPAELSIPYLAAFRLIERSVNPAFDLILRCNNCGGMNNAVVSSVNRKSKKIGIQCSNKNCGQTLKFEEPIDVEAKGFPDRLRKAPESALVPPKGAKKTKPDPEWTDEVFGIVFDE